MIESINNSSETIGTDPVVVSEQKDLPAERSVIYMVNRSTGGQIITISPYTEAKNGEGIVISPGGFYQESKDSGFIPTQYRISAVSDVAGAILSIHERVVQHGI